MRRNITCFFCLFVAVTVMRAQSVFQSEWVTGVSGGVNYATTVFSPKVQQSMYMGYTGGVTLRWVTEKNLGLQLEVNFKQQGWNERFDNADDGHDYSGYYYRRRMNYADIPFFTHIYFGNERMNFFVNLGPQIGFLLKEKTDDNLNGIEPQRMNAQHTMPAEKSVEWGIGGGPGIELRTGVGYFLLEGRYYYALSDFYGTRRKDAFSKASAQVISVKLSYLIPFH
jgi:hypothetical protein